MRCRESGIEIVTRQSFLNDPSESVRNLRRQVIHSIVKFVPSLVGLCLMIVYILRMPGSLSVYSMSLPPVESCAKCTSRICMGRVTSGSLLAGTKIIGTRLI